MLSESYCYFRERKKSGMNYALLTEYDIMFSRKSINLFHEKGVFNWRKNILICVIDNLYYIVLLNLILFLFKILVIKWNAMF